MIALIDMLSAHTLRIGALLELSACFMANFLFMTSSGIAIFQAFHEQPDMRGMPVDKKAYEEKIKLAVAAVRSIGMASNVAALMWALGALFILGFAVKITSDVWYSSQHRLFRYGGNFLYTGATLDFIWTLINLAVWTSVINYLKAPDEVIAHFLQGGFFTFGVIAYKCLIGFQSLLYGVSFLLLDLYHPEGGSTCLAWTLFYSWTACGVIVLVTNFLPLPVFLTLATPLLLAYTVSVLLSIILTVAWSFTIEPVVNRHLAKDPEDVEMEHGMYGNVMPSASVQPLYSATSGSMWPSSVMGSYGPVAHAGPHGVGMATVKDRRGGEDETSTRQSSHAVLP
ncbi:unnamed protein product [Vitrella brassicaformis CCMP3155]|uniref:Transmembrane protein n=1 Tax=Vitrella brassicaformis (strain CCMP3155) TaxID=1169540 RepID=A0A0G4H3S7_VITBC|nr:unnamed protein product [Vitrella brassicaformis CCMP3155]|mmetsp:Transcript_6962/g.20177  ORF Transcript_6962/g.20177 Transcript_6962/m.20177 type:complete len:340 (-) Transcript_6962:1167-2186(-)|eukprot:CEM38167.1 unnamed protein product [Vitrella brassicaformis CCMP3155]